MLSGPYARGSESVMAEDDDGINDGQLPRFPAREHDQERVRRGRSEKHERGWLAEVILLIVDFVGSWP